MALKTIIKTTQRSDHTKSTQPSFLQARASDKFFFLAYDIWLCLMVLNTSLLAKYLAIVYLAVRLLCLTLLLLGEITQLARSGREALGICIAGIMCISALRASDTVLIDSIFFIVCGRNKDFDEIARHSIKMVSFSAMLVVVAAMLGFIVNYVGWSGGRERSYLGFRYALFPASYLFLITCLEIYLVRDDFSLWHALALTGCNVVVFIFTASRLSFYLSVFVVVAAYALVRIRTARPPTDKRYNSIICLLFSSAFIVAAVMSFAFVYGYASGNAWMMSLDGSSALGGRLGISNNALQQYGVSAFGRELHFSGAALSVEGATSTGLYYDYIDNLFVKALVNYGVIFLVLFVALMTAVIWRAYANRDSYLVLILVVLAMHSMIDNAAINLYYDTFLFLTGQLMVGPSKSAERLEEPHTGRTSRVLTSDSKQSSRVRHVKHVRMS